MAKTNVSVRRKWRERALVARAAAPPTAIQLRKMLRYDPETGKFHWLERMNGRRAGCVGYVSKKQRDYNRIVICINYTSYFAHRLAWLYMTGKWPKKLIDHINRNPMDNRWSNLREVNHSQNGRNMRLRKDNTSGISGVVWHKQAKKWKVDLICDTKKQAIQIASLHRKLIEASAGKRLMRRMEGRY